MRLIKTRKIHLVLEIRSVFPAVIGAAAAPKRSTLAEAAATLVHPPVIAAAIFRSESAAAGTIRAAGTAATTMCGLVGKVNLNRQNVPGFDAVTLLILAHQRNKLIITKTG